MIGLSPTKGFNNLMYELIFGAFGNTEAVVRRNAGGIEITRAITGKLLNQDLFQDFWIHINDSIISMGIGMEFNFLQLKIS